MPEYNVLSILRDLITKRYDVITNNKQFYEISARDNRAYPVYGDVVAGIYTRYFACRSNLVKDGPVFEIDGGQYKSLTSNPNFVTVELQWRIRGKINDESFGWIDNKEIKNPGVISQNKALIENAAQKIPALVYYMFSADEEITKKRMLEYYQGDFVVEE